MHSTTQTGAVSPVALAERMVLFTEKSWSYAKFFEEKFSEYIPIKGYDWERLIQSGVSRFVVHSLSELANFHKLCSKYGVYPQIWYAAPHYRESHGDYWVEELVDVMFYDAQQLANAVVVIESDTYRNLTKLTNDLDGRPIIYEDHENLNSMFDLGYNRIAVSANSTNLSKVISKYIRPRTPERLNIIIHLIYFKMGEYDVKGFSQRVITLTA